MTAAADRDMIEVRASRQPPTADAVRLVLHDHGAETSHYWLLTLAEATSLYAQLDQLTAAAIRRLTAA